MPADTAAYRAVAALAVLGGAALRLAHYLDRRSLWLDECMMAVNIAARGFLDLLRPLDYNQAAPPLFLWGERLAALLGGFSELSFRAIPMAAGIALVPLMGVVARPLAGPVGAGAAMALAALSPTLIRYANETKPYGTDAFLTVALLAAVLRLVARPEDGRRWIVLAVSGVAALLSSIPSVFVLGAVLAALLAHPAAGGRRLWTTALAAAWGLTILLLFLGLYRTAARNSWLQQGYDRAFLSPGPDLPGRLLLALPGTLLPAVAGDGASAPGVPAAVPWMLGAAYLGGLAWLGRRAGAWSALLLAGPLGLAFLGSALRVYPVGVPRLMAFGAPLLILMLAASVAAAVEWLRARARPEVLLALALTLGALLAAPRVRDARKPWRGEEAARLVAAFRQRPRVEEPVYVGARGIPSWVFYTTNWERPNRERLAFYAWAASAGPSFENAPPRQAPLVDAGADLVYRFRDRRQELLGLPSGNQWRWPTYVKRTPDAGWAQNEAARIAREANPCAWLYFTHTSDNGARPITWVLRDDYQARRRFRLIVPGGALFRYCFPGRG